VALQSDLNRVTGWADKWLMSFNVEKCKVMHIREGAAKTVPIINLTMHDPTAGVSRQLATTTLERDLGVMIASNLKVGPQVDKAAAKASSILGMLKRTFTCRDEALWKKLYMTYVRCHLEYAIQAWSPYQKGDIEVLERVQHHASLVPWSMRHLSYTERLAHWELTTLEERRHRGDMIEMFKIENGIDSVSWVTPPVRVAARAQRREQLRRERNRNCEHAFVNRVIPGWNSLSAEVIKAGEHNKVYQFKNSFWLL